MLDKIDILCPRSVSLRMLNPHMTGNIKRHRAFPSKILGNRRDVLVYLPRGYRRFVRDATRSCICTTDRMFLMRPLHSPAWNGASMRLPND